MLSVAQAAQQLGVSTARVRALIASDLLPAQKVGRAWLLREEDVLRRKALCPRPGRPRRGQGPPRASDYRAASCGAFDRHALYVACKNAAAEAPCEAATEDEAAFYEAIRAFFVR